MTFIEYNATWDKIAKPKQLIDQITLSLYFCLKMVGVNQPIYMVWDAAYFQWNSKLKH